MTTVPGLPDGRSLFVVAHEEVTIRELAAAELQRRLSFESLLADIAGRFVGTGREEVLAEIESALLRVAENLSLDRVTFWNSSPENPEAMQLRCQARRDGSPPLPLGADARDLVPWVVEQLRSTRQPLLIEDLAQLPAEAQLDQAALVEAGVRASLTVPLVRRNGQLAGCISFTLSGQESFPLGTLNRVQVFANVVHALLLRLDDERALLESLEERQQLQEQIIQAQKLESIGRLAGGVAHDFNNLMMGIMGYTEACREELAPDHPAQAWLEDILKESDRSVKLVRQLLAFARKQVLQPTHLDLNPQIGGMLKMLERLIGEHIVFTWSPDASAHMVYTDPSHIDQIMVNLCVNAADAIDGHGAISVATRQLLMDTRSCETLPGMMPGTYLLLSISDTGCGMDEATRARAFDPFFTTKEVGRGTGLGLATVYGAVKQSNGFIHINSAPGAGTTVEIYFPTREQDQVATSEPAGKASLPRGCETILLVEDELSIRTTLSRLLGGLGYSVLEAEHPEQAMELLKDHPIAIDVLLSDVVMPGMNGVELQKALTAKFPSLKTILMSGYTPEVLRGDGARAGRTRRLAKPVSLATLATTIREVLTEADESAH